MNNFVAYDYKAIKPSDLSSKTILMIGRGSDRIKRFELGINAMEHIIKEIPDAEMKIISKTTHIQNLQKLTKRLNLSNNIKFVG